MQAYERENAVVIPVVADDCAALWKAMEGWIERGKKQFVLDFTGVEFINSVNIAQVIAARSRAHGLGAKVQVAGLKDNIRAVFRILRLDRLFTLDLTLDAAVAATR